MTDQAAGLSLIDLDAGTVTVHPDLHAKGMYLPGPTYDPDVWLLRPNDPGPLEAWNLAGPAPVLLPGKAPGWGQNRAVALLDSTHMIFFGGNTGNSWRMDQGGSWTVVSPYRIEGDKQMRFSPDGTRLVTTTSGPATLTALEFDLLAALTSSPGRVFTRRQLIERVWGWDFYGDERIVDVHVRKLRQAIGDSADNPRFVATIRGVGYKFIGTTP
ncbi:MAG: hypothetical protein CVT68_00420 [Actinobacteria bacterium HGW-Actinobacteria-8]|nr:MAG: hypothetical protein CVT68_00420 [Actinobacteria bacterium HGW-Actinobacteria-8]